jgi:hypothetical protein
VLTKCRGQPAMLLLLLLLLLQARGRVKEAVAG